MHNLLVNESIIHKYVFASLIERFMILYRSAIFRAICIPLMHYVSNALSSSISRSSSCVIGSMQTDRANTAGVPGSHPHCIKLRKVYTFSPPFIDPDHQLQASGGGRACGYVCSRRLRRSYRHRSRSSCSASPIHSTNHCRYFKV